MNRRNRREGRKPSTPTNAPESLAMRILHAVSRDAGETSKSLGRALESASVTAVQRDCDAVMDGMCVCVAMGEKCACEGQA